MSIEKAQEVLKHYFGFDEFRPMQAEIIQALLDNKDCLVLMPTGGGKSVCYQVPALVKEGLGIVVSPLIALMKDQVEALNANGVKAAYLNSTLTEQQQSAVEKRAINGEFSLLYVSPEKLLTEEFQYVLSKMRLSLFAIDEAHCISQWGHDFRPEYTKLAVLRKQFPNVPQIALTATADKTTRKDILRQLNFTDPKVFIDSFDRPNITLNVAPGQKKFQQLLRLLRKYPGQSGIIYCLSRKNTEQLAEKLKASGFTATYYHAGLEREIRAKTQEDFINDNVPIVCATIAFGMGIDKPDIRFIVHYNLPKNLEGYYQEIGRAGRDGLSSEALLFNSFADLATLRSFLDTETEQGQVQLAKLERMKEFADAQICRRKILLSYFGEELAKHCGNCDVCQNPPEYFDGTVLAQKALSAIARLEQSVSASTLVDVLKGARKAYIVENGYNKIKTFGGGSDLSAPDWQQYVMQLIHIGLLEVAYDEGNALKLTDAAYRVLHQKETVYLVKAGRKESKGQQEEQPKQRSRTEQLNDRLFEHLRKLRKQMADQQGVPPYVVFNDATLQEMVLKKPTTGKAFKAISGVSDKKLDQYGDDFMDAMISFMKYETEQGNRIKGSTYVITYDLYQKGYTVDDMAKERNLNPVTIYSHLAHLYDQGYEIPILSFLEGSDYSTIKDAIQQTGETQKVKPLYDYLDQEMPYYKIRLGLTYFRKQETMAQG